MDSLIGAITIFVAIFGAGVAFGALYVEQKLDALRYGDR